MKKYSLALLIAAAIALELMGAVQYFMAHQGVESELLAQAQRDIEDNQRVTAVKAEVETTIRNLLPMVQGAVNSPKMMTKQCVSIVADNPHIVGAGVALKEDYYKHTELGYTGLYAPYVYDDRPESELTAEKRTKANVRISVLNFDYSDREWFKGPMADGKSLWTQPYLDKGGTHILMITYCAVVRDLRGERVGVFFADVPLKDVSLLSQGLYSGISHSGMVTLALQVLSMLILGFIIWRAVVAMRRYKEKVVDPEKEHLAEQLRKLREVNGRLTQRNQELAKKVADLELRVKSIPQQTDQHWFG